MEITFSSRIIFIHQSLLFTNECTSDCLKKNINFSV